MVSALKKSWKSWKSKIEKIGIEHGLFFSSARNPDFFADQKPAFSIHVSDCIRTGLKSWIICPLHSHFGFVTCERAQKPPAERSALYVTDVYLLQY